MTLGYRKSFAEKVKTRNINQLSGLLEKKTLQKTFYREKTESIKLNKFEVVQNVNVLIKGSYSNLKPYTHHHDGFKNEGNYPAFFCSY